MQKLRLKALAEKFREGVRIELVPHAPRALAEDDEGDEDAEEDVEYGQPQDPHAEHSGRTAKADDGRRRDEGRPVGDGHDYRMHLASGQQVVFRARRLNVA